MALSLGTLFVKLSADPSQLTKGMGEAADKVAKFGNKMNEVAGKLGAVGVSLTAIGAGALRLAGQFDSQVKGATDELGNAFAHISVEIGRALLPVVQALTQAFAIVANWMKGLSPETKTLAAGFAATAAAVLTLTAGAAKVVSAFTALAPAISGALAPIVPVLLPILGVLAAVIAVVPLLWMAWKENWGNIQGYTGAVIDWIGEKWEAFKSFFGKSSSWIGEAWSKVTGFLWNVWASAMKKIAGAAASIAKVFGQDWSNELEAFNETIDDVASRGFGGLVDDATSSIKTVAFAWKEGAKDIGNTVKDYIGKAFEDVFSGAQTKLDKLEDSTKKMAKTIVFEPLEIRGKIRNNDDENKTANFGAALQMAMGIVISAMGQFGGVINTFIQAIQATGSPMMALAVVFVDLLTKTESFGRMTESLSKMLESIIGFLDRAFGWLFDAIAMVADGLTWLFDFIASLTPKPTATELKDGLLPVEVLPPLAELGDAAGAAAESLSALNESITNVPAGFKVAAARFNAMAPDVYQFGAGVGGDINVSLTLDGREIHRSIIIRNARDSYVKRGGPKPPSSWRP